MIQIRGEGVAQRVGMDMLLNTGFREHPILLANWPRRTPQDPKPDQRRNEMTDAYKQRSVDSIFPKQGRSSYLLSLNRGLYLFGASCKKPRSVFGFTAAVHPTADRNNARSGRYFSHFERHFLHSLP